MNVFYYVVLVYSTPRTADNLQCILQVFAIYTWRDLPFSPSIFGSMVEHVPLVFLLSYYDVMSICRWFLISFLVDHVDLVS